MSFTTKFMHFSLTGIVSVLPALLVVPAMASAPKSSGNAFVFGDVMVQNGTPIEYMAFGGRRMDNWVNNKYQNDFPKYNMVGRSITIANGPATTPLYVGPVNLTLRELTGEDAFSYNYQMETNGNPADGNEDVDLAALAGVTWLGDGFVDGEGNPETWNWATNRGTIYDKVAAVINQPEGYDNANATAPGLAMFATRNNGMTAASMSLAKTNAVIDGATVTADTINVTNDSVLTFVKQDKSLLNTSSSFYVVDASTEEGAYDGIRSSGLTTLNAGNLTVDSSRLIVKENQGAALVLNVDDASFANTASGEGALTVKKNGSVTINGDSLVFDNNKSTSHGAGVYYKDTIGGETNFAEFNSKDITFSNNKVLASATSGSGAGIFVAGGNVSILGETNTFDHNAMNATIVDDRKYKVGGGAVANQSYDNENKSNPATIDAVMVIGKNAESENSFSYNTSVTNGGAIMNRAVDNTDGDAFMTINGSTTFADNSAYINGGAIYNMVYGDHVAQTTFNDDVVFSTNSATGDDTFNINGYVYGGQGGAIFNGGGAEMTFNGTSAFTNNTAKSSGGAIDNLHSVMTFNDLATFTGNSVTAGDGQGGAIRNKSGTISFNNGATFIGNTSTSSGSAIYNGKNHLYGGVINIVGDSLFQSNNGNYAIHNVSGNDAENHNIVAFSNGDATFSGNTGGAIWNQDIMTFANMGDILFDGNTIVTADSSAISNVGSMTINANTFTVQNNVYEGANKKGAAIGNTAAGSVFDLTANNVSFINNTGGAIYKENDNFTITAADTITFSGNTGANAAAINNNGNYSKTTLTADKIVFDGNTDSGSYGGAIFNSGDYVKLLANEVSFLGNEANATTSTAASMVKYGGGAISNRGNSGSSQITEIVIGNDEYSIISFESNTSAMNGGAIHACAESANDKGKITINGESGFVSNTAALNGGAISNSPVSGESTITFNGNASFTGNSATNGGAVYNTGSIVFNGTTSFDENNATNGGAIYNTTTMTLTDTTFSDNTALTAGGAIYNSGTMNIFANNTDVLFSGNKIGTIGDYTANDIYNESTLNLGASNEKQICLAGGIDGDGILNINADESNTGTVSIANALRNHTVTISNGTLELNDADITGSTITNGGTLVLNESTEVSLADFIDDTAGAININSGEGYTGKVSIAGNLKNQTVTVEQGTLELNDTNVAGSQITNNATVEMNATETAMTLTNGVYGDETVANNILNINTYSSNTGTVSIANALGNQTVTLSHGILNVSGLIYGSAITNNAILNLTDVTVTDSTIANNETLNLNANQNQTTSLVGGLAESTGTLNVNDGVLNAGKVIIGGNLKNQTISVLGGTLELNNADVTDSTITNNSILNLNATGTSMTVASGITGTGTLNINNGVLNTDKVVIANAVTDQTINILHGTLEMGNVDLTGSTIANNASLILNAADDTTMSVNGGINGVAENVANNILNINANESDTGTVSIANALRNQTVNVSNGKLELNDVNVTGSQITNNATVEMNATETAMNLTGGVYGDGELNINTDESNTGKVSIATALQNQTVTLSHGTLALKDMISGSLISNNSTLELNDAVVTGSTITNGGTLALNTTTEMSLADFIDDTAGTVNINSGEGYTGKVSIASNLQNQTVTVERGTLELNNADVTGSTITNNSILNLNALTGETMMVASGVAGDGTLNINTGITTPGKVVIATALTNQEATVSQGTLDLSGVVSGSTITNNATLNLNEVGAAASRIVNNTANAIIDIQESSFVSGISTDNGGAIYNKGKIMLTDTSFTDNTALTSGGAIYNEGTADIISANTFVVFGGNQIGTSGNYIANDIYNKKTLNLKAVDDYGITIAGGIDGSKGTININKGEGYTGTVSIANTLKNQTVNVSNGTLEVDDAVVCGSKITNNSILNINNSAVSDNAITNNATMNLNAGAEKTTTVSGGIDGIAENVATNILNINTDEANVGTVSIATALNNQMATVAHGTLNLSGSISGSTIINNTTASLGMTGVEVSGSTIVNNGVLSLSGTNLLEDSGIIGNGNLTVNQNAVLNIGTNSIAQRNIYLNGNMFATLRSGDAAQIKASTFGGSGTLNLTMTKVGTYHVFDVVTFNDGIFDGLEWNETGINKTNPFYNLVWKGGDVTAEKKTIEEIAQFNNIEHDTAKAVSHIMDSTSKKINALSLKLQERLVAKDPESVERVIKAISPEKESVVQSVATSIQNTVASLAAGRMSVPVMGRSGGDVKKAVGGIWAQGIYNKLKQEDNFDGRTNGLAFGIDQTVDKKYTLGIGFAFSKSNVNGTEREVAIDSSSVFMYGQYKKDNWYLNGLLNYTVSDYSENGENPLLDTDIIANYDVHAFGANVRTGYSFKSGMTPELGLRYLHVSADDYWNTMNIRSSLKDTNFVTLTAGSKYVFPVSLGRRFVLNPELHALAKYDVISDAQVATITMPGAAPYSIDGKRLARLGGEFGIGLGTRINKLDLSLSYDVETREAYYSQTGRVRFRYGF